MCSSPDGWMPLKIRDIRATYPTKKRVASD
jgi:hypothetical protein